MARIIEVKRSRKNSFMCECGKKICLSLDLQELGNIVESHALEHARQMEQGKAEAECNRIQDLLIEKALKTILKNKNKFNTNSNFDSE